MDVIKRLININDISVEDYEKYFSLMSDEKKKRLNRFRFENDRKRSVAGEMLARQMISEYCSANEGDIVFLPDKFGKPYAKGLKVHFSISHSNDMALCAVGPSPVGADIEKIREIKDSVIERVCTEHEIEYVNKQEITHEERMRRFFEVWTFKEAYFKYLGTGLSDFKSLDLFSCEKEVESVTKDGYVYCIIK